MHARFPGPTGLACSAAERRADERGAVHRADAVAAGDRAQSVREVVHGSADLLHPQGCRRRGTNTDGLRKMTKRESPSQTREPAFLRGKTQSAPATAYLTCVRDFRDFSPLLAMPQHYLSEQPESRGTILGCTGGQATCRQERTGKAGALRPCRCLACLRSAGRHRRARS